MTVEPLQLFDVPASHHLTDRQQAVLNALRRAGQDGLHADECGAIAHELKQGRWAHTRDERCQFCGQDGMQILRRLRELGLVRYRAKLKAWVAVGIPESIRNDPEPPDHAGDGPVPYNAFPAGF